MFAAIQAACGIDPGVGDAEFFGADLHIVAEFFGPLGSAGAARVVVRAAIAADKDVMFEIR